MNTLLWIIQIILALAFSYSGIAKATQPTHKLVAMGQTGIEQLPVPLIRFIGIAELAGAAGLILPGLMNQFPALTPASALCLGLIMIPAGVIHYRRGEIRTVWTVNATFLILCLSVVYGRWS